MIIDAHCHLTDEQFLQAGVDKIIKRANDVGVALMISSGYDLESSILSAKLSEQFEGVYFCAGFHPGELAKYKDEDLEKLRTLCAHEKCVAVGEIGLDYHYDNNPEPTFQRELFIKQLQLADELGLPVVLHSRDAAKETLDILIECQSLLKKGGVMHCYSYSPEMMEEFLKLGLSFSFGGASTFKNSKKAQECIRRIPAPFLLSETDCPYLTPEPFRGIFPNEPKNICFVVENMAKLRGEEVEQITKQIETNVKKLFFKVK